MRCNGDHGTQSIRFFMGVDMKRFGRAYPSEKCCAWVRFLLPVVALMTAAPIVALAQIVELNIDRAGSDYRNFVLAAPSYELCLRACAKDDRCKAWTYVQPGLQGPSARCWLKSVIPDKRASTCCISGYKKNAVAKPNMPERPVSAGITQPSSKSGANDLDDLGLGKLERLEELR